MNLAALKADLLPKVKMWLQIDFADQDTLLTGMIGKSIDWIENYTLQRLYERQIVVNSYSEEVEIFDNPFALVSITDGAATPGAITGYDTVNNILSVKYCFYNSDKKVITYATGLTVIPEITYEAIFKIVAYNYENRLPTNVIPYDVKEDLGPFRRISWF